MTEYNGITRYHYHVPLSGGGREKLMKKRISVFLAVAIMLSLAGCGRAAGDKTPDAHAADTRQQDTDTQQQDADTESLMTMNLRIVDGSGTGSLVLAGESADAVYTMGLSDIDIYLDGEPADASALEDGMMAEVICSMIQETYPGQLAGVESVSVCSRGTENNPGGGYYDLCGLYLQVLNDLWDVDSGLNGGAAYVSVDLSEAPGGLTEGEKAALTWIFACAHQVEGLSCTYEELAAEGYLAEVEWASHPKEVPALYQWEDGVLFSITSGEWEDGEMYSLPVLKFDAQKWRSPLGAYYFTDCEATWAEFGSWGSYSVGGEAIS